MRQVLHGDVTQAVDCESVQFWSSDSRRSVLSGQESEGETMSETVSDKLKEVGWYLCQTTCDDGVRDIVLWWSIEGWRTAPSSQFLTSMAVLHSSGPLVLPTEIERCDRCGWPLKDDPKDGCVKGNCSQRPLPPKKEAEPKSLVDVAQCAIGSSECLSHADWEMAVAAVEAAVLSRNPFTSELERLIQERDQVREENERIRVQHDVRVDDVNALSGMRRELIEKLKSRIRIKRDDVSVIDCTLETLPIYTEIAIQQFAEENDMLLKAMGHNTDAPEPNGTVFATRNWWKYLCDDLHEENAKLKAEVETTRREADCYRMQFERDYNEDDVSRWMTAATRVTELEAELARIQAESGELRDAIEDSESERQLIEAELARLKSPPVADRPTGRGVWWNEEDGYSIYYNDDTAVCARPGRWIKIEKPVFPPVADPVEQKAKEIGREVLFNTDRPIQDVIREQLAGWGPK